MKKNTNDTLIIRSAGLRSSVETFHQSGNYTNNVFRRIIIVPSRIKKEDEKLCNRFLALKSEIALDKWSGMGFYKVMRKFA